MLGSSGISEQGMKVSGRILRHYLLRGEEVLVATRLHWVSLAEPVITVVVSFFFVAWISTGLANGASGFANFLWLIWLALIAHLVWKVFEWRSEWFCATNARLLLTYGLFSQKVAMMPLTKVTDLSYGRSPLGRVAGYGDFTLESAGQDQALRHIEWIPDPDRKYQDICDVLFKSELDGDADVSTVVGPIDDEPGYYGEGSYDGSLEPDLDPTGDIPRPRSYRPGPRRFQVPKKGAAQQDGWNLDT